MTTVIILAGGTQSRWTGVHIDDYTQDFDLLSQYYDFIGLVKNTQIDLSK